MRRPVADHLPSYGGPQPIGTDERASRDALARGQAHGDALAILVVAQNLAAHAQLDPRIGSATAQKNPVQVAAMNDGIGIAEALAEFLPEVDLGEVLARERVHEAQLVDIDGIRSRRLADAQIVESVKSIGPELNAGADLAKDRRLFQHDHPVSAFR